MDVLECLSKQIRDDAVNAKPFSVSATCRQQMRFEMLQRVCKFCCKNYEFLEINGLPVMHSLSRNTIYF